MKQGLVVYGVRDMVEYNAIIRLGSGTLNVHFRHGSFSGLGSNSAEYRTDDPAIQFAIEQSEYFKSGRITILSDKRCEAHSHSGQCHEGGTASEAEQSREEMSEPSGSEDEASEGLTEIEVATREDAKQYLVDKFGIKASALRSKDAIHEQARGQGIRFVGASDL